VRERERERETETERQREKEREREEPNTSCAHLVKGKKTEGEMKWHCNGN
jgi:hypothetical protein